MKKNLFIQYRKWVFFWSLFLDKQHEVQKVLNNYNTNGWYCVQFEWDGINKYNIFRILMILLLTILTLGFVSYWNGFSIVFERQEISESEMKSIEQNKASLEVWRKENPNKNLNEFYKK